MKSRIIAGRLARGLVALIVVLFAFVPPALGQSLLLNDPNAAHCRFGTQFLAPSWTGDAHLAQPSGAAEFYGSLPFSPRAALAFRVPYSSFRYDVPGYARRSGPRPGRRPRVGCGPAFRPGGAATSWSCSRSTAR